MMLARAAGLILALAATGVLAAPDKRACRERLRDLDERRAEVFVGLEEANRETVELQRRTGALDAERRTIDGSTDRFLVAEYNTRAALHRTRVEDHNKRIAAINRDVDTVNRAIQMHNEECKNR